MTFDPGLDIFPVWTPDGRRIIFSSSRGGVPNLYWQAADNTGTIERLTTSTNAQFSNSISPDGTRVLFAETVPKTSSDIGLLTLTGPSSGASPAAGRRPSAGPGPAAGRTEALIQTTFGELNGEISADGRWVAYQSNESGMNQVYVRPFPKVDGGHWQVSASGGTRPAWARNGRELFYVDGSNRLTVVPVQTAGLMFTQGNPTKLLETPYYIGNNGRTYDVSPDGQRFLMIKNEASTDQSSTSTPASMVVIEHWVEELKARVGAR